MSKINDKAKRVNRIKAKMKLSSKKAVFVVNKSLKHLEVYLQIDNRIVGGVSTKNKEFADLDPKKRIILLAKKIAEVAKTNKIQKAVLHRNGNLYTSNVKLLAEAIREEGITL